MYREVERISSIPEVIIERSLLKFTGSYIMLVTLAKDNEQPYGFA